MRMLAASLALLGALAAGGISMAATDVIRGSVTYRERMALPPGASLEVELIDVSKADAPAVVIASDVQPVVRQVPIPFTLVYDPAAIDPKNSYALTARLSLDGATLFRSTATTPVLTQGAGDTPEILLVQSAPADTTEAPAPAAPEAQVEALTDPALLAATWIAEEINGAPSAEKVVSWMKLTAEGRAQGQGGCNSFSGSYKLDGGTLSFGPVASTRRACPETQMSQEDRFFATLGAVKSGRIEDGKLVLTDLEGNALVTFHRK